MATGDLFPNSTFTFSEGYALDCNCEGSPSAALGNISSNVKIIADNSYNELGFNGHEFVTDGSFSGEEFIALVAWDGADATVNYSVAHDGTLLSFTDVLITSGGIPIYGDITNLVVTDGTVKAYYKYQE